VLQIAQAAVNDSGRAAGHAGGKVVLFDQQGAFAGAGTFARYGDSVDTAANDDDLEVLGFQGRSRFGC